MLANEGKISDPGEQRSKALLRSFSTSVTEFGDQSALVNWIPDVYLEPCQTSMNELFCENG